jgi:hypothetical protein
MVMIVGLGTNNRLNSRLIRHATRSWCSHAWLEVDCEHAIHATSDGVVEEDLPMVWLAYPRMRRYSVKLHDAELAHGAAQARALIGQPYDWGVIPNGFALWWWYITGMVSRVRRDEQSIHCSELVCLVLRSMPLVKKEQIDPELTHPGKLDAWCIGHPQMVEV